ncbi:DUF177 domain-containing protein [uncultured Varibaculum sp.]|uniref:YceD family protein n=1 Tax=uncultured Varibaculum sp. TaxID=413896 RepID=UPI00288A1910|nr:DUF177 domain-containing protein [uncultured Varibaculum sp.]
MKQVKKATIPLELTGLGSSEGDSKTWQLQVTLPTAIGTEDMAVPAGQSLDLQLLAVAISEGVSLSVSGAARAEGNCVRCLQPVKKSLDFSLSRVYYYPEELAHLLNEVSEDSIVYADLDEAYQVQPDSRLDLEPLLIDAIVPQIPYSVLCSPDCPGLCPECGIMLAKAEADHHHEKIDPRWSVLANLFDEQEKKDE